MTRRAALFVVLLALPFTSVSAQSCPSACQPAGNGKQGSTSSVVSIGFGAGFSSDAGFERGKVLHMWNDMFLRTWSDLWFATATTGPAQIMIVLDPNADNGAFNDTNTYGYGTIHVGPEYLNRGMRFLASRHRS